MTDNEVTAASGAVDRLAGLVDATDGDRRARRRLLERASRVLQADAEAERKARAAELAADRRVRAVEADAEARIRAAEARLRVQERERAASRAERDATRAEQAATREVKAEAADLRRAAWNHRRELAGAAAPATLSMIVYLAAVASAVFGQVSVATGRYGWPMWRALVLAGFVELMALAMALTSNRLRIRGERAMAPRVLTWVFAGFAATINVWGHWQDPLMAIGLGAASLGGITLWEIRSSARHRDALRRAGQLAEPLPPLGTRFWLFAPAVAMAAYRVGVRTRVSTAAAPLVAQAEAERAARRAALTGRRHRTGLLLPAAFAAGLAAALLIGMTVPAAARLQPVWWLTGAGATAVLLTAVALIPRRQVTVAPTAHSVPVLPPPAPPVAPEPAIADRSAAALGASPEGHPQPPAGPDGRPQPLEAPVGQPAAGSAEADTADVGAAHAPVTTAHGSPVMSATGEFRALTAPEHYGRDATGGEGRLLLPAGSTAALPAAQGNAAAGTNGTGMLRTGNGAKPDGTGMLRTGATPAGRSVGGVTARVPAPRPVGPPPGSPVVQAAAAPDLGRRSAPGAQKRSGLPEEARVWIAECLSADRTPTGPEVGRRYQVDASTGRRWVRQVREGLPGRSED